MEKTPCHANEYDLAKAPVLAARERDWRNGAIVYQVFVDRFAPSHDLDAKRHLYPAPKTLHNWAELPSRGCKVDELGVWSQELQFWGGDLTSLRGKLDYVQTLGVDVLYLNPIQLAYTNHKYDAIDYFKVSPEYGTRDDVIALAHDCHRRDMKLMLDGVFNHMGKHSPFFKEAMEIEESEYREWYFIGSEFTTGYRGWVDVPNLPEVRVENVKVRNRLWREADSVVQGYLRDGVDGWRLDVACDLGFNYLKELTDAAHDAKSDSWVVGEVWNYPEQWSPSLDGIMNMHARFLILSLMQGKIAPAHFGRLVARMIEDAGLEWMLKCWLVLDNHDTRRLRHEICSDELRHMAQVLQFTLPGSPVIYYGTELGMDGGDDPLCRAPMRWDLASDSNANLAFMKKLIAIRKSSRALRIGDFRLLDTDHLLAFARITDRVTETTIVIANPAGKHVREIIAVRDGKLMSSSELVDELTGSTIKIYCGALEIDMPPRTVRIFKLAPAKEGKYSSHKRVQ